MEKNSYVFYEWPLNLMGKSYHVNVIFVTVKDYSEFGVKVTLCFFFCYDKRFFPSRRKIFNTYYLPFSKL